MVKLYDGGAYLVNGMEIIPDAPDALEAVKSKTGTQITKQDGVWNTEGTQYFRKYGTASD